MIWKGVFWDSYLSLHAYELPNWPGHHLAMLIIAINIMYMLPSTSDVIVSPCEVASCQLLLCHLLH